MNADEPFQESVDRAWKEALKDFQLRKASTAKVRF
jgi:hypothetical protein